MFKKNFVLVFVFLITSQAEAISCKRVFASVKQLFSPVDVIEAAQKGDAKAIISLHNKGDLNVRDESGDTPAHLVAENGQVDALEALGKLGAKLNAKNKIGLTPIEIAVANGHVQIIGVFNKLGVNLDEKSSGENTLIHIAARNGQSEVIKFLIHLAGLDVNAKNNLGYNPAHLAARNRHEKTLRILQELGVDMESKSNEGETPTDIASRNGLL